MSIYATLWQLKFPRDGDDYLGCEWITVPEGIAPGDGHVPTTRIGKRNGGYGHETT